MTDREQIRRDAEVIVSCPPGQVFATDTELRSWARDYLALLTELEQAERRIEQLEEQTADSQ